MKDLYKIAYECRNADSVRFWTMFGLMTTVNGGLLAFVGTNRQDKSFVILFCVLGILACLLWLLMQVRYARWCEHWDKKLRELEPLVKEEINASRKQLLLEIMPETLGLFKGTEKPKLCGLSTRIGACLMAVLFAFAWGYLWYIVPCK